MNFMLYLVALTTGIGFIYEESIKLFLKTKYETLKNEVTGPEAEEETVSESKQETITSSCDCSSIIKECEIHQSEDLRPCDNTANISQKETDDHYGYFRMDQAKSEPYVESSVDTYEAKFIESEINLDDGLAPNGPEVKYFTSNDPKDSKYESFDKEKLNENDNHNSIDPFSFALTTIILVLTLSVLWLTFNIKKASTNETELMKKIK